MFATLVASIMSLVCGFSIAIAIELFWGRAKARTLPGGSLGCGVVFGLIAHAGVLPVILGAVCGLVGWIIYRLLFR